MDSNNDGKVCIALCLGDVEAKFRDHTFCCTQCRCCVQASAALTPESGTAGLSRRLGALGGGEKKSVWERNPRRPTCDQSLH